MIKPGFTQVAMITPWGEDQSEFWTHLLNGDCCYEQSCLLPEDRTTSSISFIHRLLNKITLAPEKKTSLAIASTLADINRLTQATVQKTTPLPLLAELDIPALRHQYGINGPVCWHPTACVAVGQAIAWTCRLIEQGIIHRGVIVAFDLFNEFCNTGFGSLKALSATRPTAFDQHRHGFRTGEAATLLVIEQDESASATIEGIGLMNDAHHLTAPHPKARGMILAIRHALAQAKITPEQIDLICTSGTGSVYNDLMESFAFQEIFAEEKIPILTAIKPQTGHCMAASAGLEIIFSLLTMQQHVILPICHLDTPLAPLASHIVKAPWRKKIRYILKTSNSFGGNNSAIIIKNKLCQTG